MRKVVPGLADTQFRIRRITFGCAERGKLHMHSRTGIVRNTHVCWRFTFERLPNSRLRRSVVCDASFSWNTCRTKSPDFPPILLGETYFVHGRCVGRRERPSK